ncbi:MAG: methyltransferase domain-containing protein [Magnetococcales bacterium]|nr:methyltransferase domain-containing protein [Magnetococcales bacterium]
MTRSRVVAATFGAAAHQYERHATAQAHAAQRLMARIQAHAWPNSMKILEIGCGTGVLSRALLRRFPECRLLCTDLSDRMVQQARCNGSEWHQVSFAVMDGEQLAVTRGWDLIVSSLTWQWFVTPLETFARVGRLLNPDGRLMVVTLGDQNFHEWRQLHTRAGLSHGMPDYPSMAAWRALLTPPACVEEEFLSQDHPSPLAFLQHLRTLGANQPRAGYPPLAAGTLRRLLRTAPHGITTSYHLIFLDARAPFFSHDSGRVSLQTSAGDEHAGQVHFYPKLAMRP